MDSQGAVHSGKNPSKRRLVSTRMLTGKRFRVTTPISALDETRVQRNAITVPAGAVLNVIDGPKPDNPLLRVVWGQRWLLMVEQDIKQHCEEIA